MQIKAIARKWGSSLAVILPKEITEKKGIKENTGVTITIERTRPKAGELWGFGKGKIKKSAQEIKDELREGWLSDSDREREKKWKNQK